MSPSEQIEIIALEMSDGAPGYFCQGHVSRQAFLDRVNGDYGEQFLLEDIRHTFRSQTPAELGLPFDEGDAEWWLCGADDEGAAPMTFVRAS